VTIRVVVAEDSLIVREGLHQLLAASPTVEVVASYGDVSAVLDAVDRDRPDVVLTDIRMPPSSTDEGIRLADELRQSRPATGVVVLSQYADPIYVLALLEHGSDRRGYLLKERIHDRGQLVSAIDTVARGGSVIDPKIVEVLVDAKARVDRSQLAVAHSPGARGARRDGGREEQRGDRRIAGAEQARGREARQLDLHETRTRRVRGRIETREGDPDVPGGKFTLNG
jgi:DNA-binding NarL/FixJ family response regulator